MRIREQQIQMIKSKISTTFQNHLNLESALDNTIHNTKTYREPHEVQNIFFGLYFLQMTVSYQYEHEMKFPSK